MRRVRLSNSPKFALVSDDDYELVSSRRWYMHHGYAVSSDGSHIDMHRLIFGDAPDGKEWDHRSRNRLDNSRENLRAASITQNAMNHGKRKDNKSGFIGVFRVVKGNYKRWVASVKVGGKTFHLGFFTNKVKAARIRDVAALEHYGEFAVLNFPKRRGA